MSLFCALIAMLGIWLSAGVFTLQAQDPIVTETHRMSAGSQQSQVLRKINGRWWTPDNRMVYPPKNRKSMIQFWQVDSKPGVVDFYHHRPFDVRRGEQLRLFMTADEVEALFGPPNRRFPMRSARGGRWYYIGANGTILNLWLMERDELGQAHYEFPNGEKQEVASIARELNGRSIFSLMAARASELSRSSSGVNPQFKGSGSGTSAKSIAEVEMRNASAAAPVIQKRFVAQSALDGVRNGDSREALIERLGEPTYKSAITGGDGVQESFTYFVEEDRFVAIQLFNGKVKLVR